MADHSNHHDSRPSRREILWAATGALAAGATPDQSNGADSPFKPGDTGPDHSSTPRMAPSVLVSRKDLSADVVVTGGGMAGVCAAVAAARNGSSVILVQDRPVLGGNASSEIRMHICGADGGGQAGKTDARETGILEELRLENTVNNPQRSPSMWDLLLYETVRREPNIQLLLNSHCCGVKKDSEDHIEQMFVSRYTTEDAFAVHGKLFIDATGDGRLGAEAGAAFRVGRESRATYGESLAPPQADRKVLGSTLLFMTREYDRPMPFRPPPWARRFERCEDLPHRYHNSWEYGYWWIEWGGELDTIKDNERIRDELLAIALGVWDHIKNSGRHPDSVNWALEWLGFIPCKRESRRFLGDHVLTQQELERGETFEDGVAFGGWSIDLHPPAGIDSPEPPAHQVRIPLYNIPLRSLYARDIRNLLLAGRIISASHVAFGSTRVMGTCSVIGQAVGTAAALCAKQSCTPRELARDGITTLQQQLLKDDAYIIGVTNQDPDDLARKATVRASSQIPEGPAANVINGVHRRVYSKTNRWTSDPKQPMPQWIELRFDRPVRITEVHLVFDSGLNRRLTLSHQNRLNARMIHGPQPETVRDYELLVLDGQSAKKIVAVQGNYQRKRIHRFEPVTATGLRLVVKATNGDPSARVFEIRAYG